MNNLTYGIRSVATFFDNVDSNVTTDAALACYRASMIRRISFLELAGYWERVRTGL